MIYPGRDQEYIQLNYDIINRTNVITGLTAVGPKSLRPVIGRLASLGAHANFKRLARMIEPEYRRRLELLQHSRGNSAISEPVDHFQMMLRFAQRERPAELNSLDVMTRRLFLANFGSMHRTVLQVVNMLLNILESSAEYNTISMLREESSRVLGLGGDDQAEIDWKKGNVSRMIRTDSVARETMRLNSFDNRGGMRKVMVDGFKTEDGIPLPRGTVLSFLGRPVQIEEGRYKDALKFDPFRFSRPHEGHAEGKPPSGLGTSSCVATSPYHLPFGHGKYACPGRHLVDVELKMILSYIVTYYDLKLPDEYNGRRPANAWRTEAQMPPEDAKILIKRRNV